jgi:molybdopterin-guanine dinucleotide biosynthesis protein A
VTRPSQRPLPLGAVLAGGAASRLGGAKALTELAGRPLISYPLDVLAQAGLEAVVVAKADSPLPSLDVNVVVEAEEPRHPLAGIVTALHRAGPRGALVLPCDAPFVSPMLVRVLASAARTTGVRTRGRAHPVIAFYAPDSLDRLQRAVAEDESATAALESLEPEWIEAFESETFNVNTSGDLARAEELLRQARS